MTGSEQPIKNALAHYRRLHVLATAISGLASILFAFIIIFNLRAIRLYKGAVGQSTLTPDDLLRAVTYTYLGQLVLGLMVVALAWVWWLTVRGAIKQLTAVSDV